MKLHCSPYAVRMVKNPLPIPTVCNICGGHVEAVANASIYGKSYGEWPYAYLCFSCGAYVGIHNYTDIPLGNLADSKTRSARKKCKPAFNTVWESGRMTRNEAYSRLAEYLGISVPECHFGLFSVQQCKDAKDWAELQSNPFIEL